MEVWRPDGNLLTLTRSSARGECNRSLLHIWVCLSRAGPPPFLAVSVTAWQADGHQSAPPRRGTACHEPAIRF